MHIIGSICWILIGFIVGFAVTSYGIAIALWLSKEGKYGFDDDLYELLLSKGKEIMNNIGVY